MTTSIEVLMTFCSKDRTRMSVPWSEGEWTYATNGMAIVRVPRLLDVEEKGRDSVPDAKKVFADSVAGIEIQWFPLPNVERKMVSCRCCLGTGKQFVCPECGGRGKVIPFTGWNEYNERDCLTCEGTGKSSVEKSTESTSTCDDCDGSGLEDSTDTVMVGGACFRSNLLALFNAFTDVKIGIIGKASAALVTFDGGDGRIMPLAEDSTRP